MSLDRLGKPHVARKVRERKFCVEVNNHLVEGHTNKICLWEKNKTLPASIIHFTYINSDKHLHFNS